MKQLFCIILIFSFLGIHAQNDKNFILRTNFGSKYSHTDYISTNTSIPQLNTETYNTRNFTLSGGKRLKSNLYYGLGLFYDFSKRESNPDMPRTNYSCITNNTIGPLIFVQYFHEISPRLALAIELYSKYDFNKELYELEVEFGQSPYYYSRYEMHSEVQTQFLRFGLLPSLRFNVFKNFGVEFTSRLFEYKQKVKDSRYVETLHDAKEYVIDFKPEDWLLGIYLKI